MVKERAEVLKEKHSKQAAAVTVSTGMTVHIAETEIEDQGVGVEVEAEDQEVEVKGTEDRKAEVETGDQNHKKCMLLEIQFVIVACH